MTTNAANEIWAKDYLDPAGVIVASGERLALAAIERVRSGERLLIRADGLNGISSSYFNIFLYTLERELGPQAIDRVDFHFTSPLHETIYQKSLSSGLKPIQRKLA